MGFPPQNVECYNSKINKTRAGLGLQPSWWSARQAWSPRFCYHRINLRYYMSIWEGEEGGSEVQDHSWKHGEFEGSLGYMRLIFKKKQTPVNYTDGIPKWTRSNFMADCLSPLCHTGAQSDIARFLALICSQFSFYCRRWSFWGRLCSLWMHTLLSAWKHLLSLGETPRHRTNRLHRWC